jgi:hypothetical protein
MVVALGGRLSDGPQVCNPLHHVTHRHSRVPMTCGHTCCWHQPFVHVITWESGFTANSGVRSLAARMTTCKRSREEQRNADNARVILG